MTTRIQFDINEKGLQELEALMREGNVRTRKELFNWALTLLKWAMRERKIGRRIASIDEQHGRYKELELPIFEAVTPQDQDQGEVEPQPATPSRAKE